MSDSVYGKPMENDGKALTRVVKKTDNRAQSSVLGYYGVDDVADLSKIGSGYNANGGKYGYSQYFVVSMAESSRAMIINASRKTYINEAALKSIVADSSDPGYISGFTWNDRLTYGGLNYAQLEDIYRTRNLVIEYAGEPSGTIEGESAGIKRIYYPLKIMVYDNCGAGFGEGAYVAIEFRVTVENTAPTLREGVGEVKNGQREFAISLKVGGTAVYNLTDFVSDPDIAVISGSSASAKQLATKEYFDTDGKTTNKAQDIVLETGDYLESLYS